MAWSHRNFFRRMKLTDEMKFEKSMKQSSGRNAMGFWGRWGNAPPSIPSVKCNVPTSLLKRLNRVAPNNLGLLNKMLYVSIHVSAISRDRQSSVRESFDFLAFRFLLCVFYKLSCLSGTTVIGTFEQLQEGERTLTIENRKVKVSKWESAQCTDD